MKTMKMKTIALILVVANPDGSIRELNDIVIYKLWEIIKKDTKNLR